VTPHFARVSWFLIEKASPLPREAVIDLTCPAENFGSSSSFGTLYAKGNKNTAVSDSQWFVRPSPLNHTTDLTGPARDGGIVEYKKDAVGKSRYQEQLENDLLRAPFDARDQDSTQPDPFVVDESTVRYWSDYNRVDYHPRSIQKLPDLFDWDLRMGDWAAGKEAFDSYNNQASDSSVFVVVMPSKRLCQDGHSLMDDPVRLFLEECDSLQVFHILPLLEPAPSIHTMKPGVTNIFGSGDVWIFLQLSPLRLQRRFPKALHPPFSVPRRA
jgi:hypothetical protein